MAFVAFASHRLDAEEELAVQALANELRALEIASRSHCERIARKLIDKGCFSLNNLFLSNIDSIESLQFKLGDDLHLTILQMEHVLKWIEDRKQKNEHDPAPNAGDLPPLPPLPAARHALPAAPELAVHVAAVPQADVAHHDIDPEAMERMFMEIT
jgi:hypothetical protein